jgi:hypothetical protein
MSDVAQPQAPKRRWFQFHLSTAVLLSLGAGALITANVWERPSEQLDDYQDIDGTQHRLSSRWRGWPISYEQIYLDGHRLNELKTAIVPMLNLIIGLVLLLALALVSESRIRHNARKS